MINGGDGINEHPTQALLDMLTMKERFGDLKGLRVAIIGDIYHSRVARSNIFGLTTMGAEVTVCGPGTLLPVGLDKLGARFTDDIHEGGKKQGCRHGTADPARTAGRRTVSVGSGIQ